MRRPRVEPYWIHTSPRPTESARRRQESSKIRKLSSSDLIRGPSSALAVAPLPGPRVKPEGGRTKKTDVTDEMCECRRVKPGNDRFLVFLELSCRLCGSRAGIKRARPGYVVETAGRPRAAHRTGTGGTHDQDRIGRLRRGTRDGRGRRRRAAAARRGPAAPDHRLGQASRSRPPISATRPTCWKGRAATSRSPSAATASSWSTASSRRSPTRSRRRSRRSRRCRSDTWSTRTITATTPAGTTTSPRTAPSSSRMTTSASASPPARATA